MTRHPKAAMAVLVIALLAISCGASPTAPPPTPEPALSLSSLPFDETTKDYIWRSNILGYGGGIQTVRWKPGLKMKIFGDGFKKSDVEKAVALIAELSLPIEFEVVNTRAEANVVMELVYPIANLPAEACGLEGPDHVVMSEIMTGVGRYALGQKANCMDRTRDHVHLAHGLLHILGLAEHTPDGPDADALSGTKPVFRLGAITRASLPWIHSVPAATRVVR